MMISMDAKDIRDAINAWLAAKNIPGTAGAMILTARKDDAQYADSTIGVEVTIKPPPPPPPEPPKIREVVEQVRSVL